MGSILRRPDPLRGRAEEQTDQLRKFLMAHIMALEVKLNEYERRIQALEKKIKEVEKT